MSYSYKLALSPLFLFACACVCALACACDVTQFSPYRPPLSFSCYSPSTSGLMWHGGLIIEIRQKRFRLARFLVNKRSEENCTCLLLGEVVFNTGLDPVTDENPPLLDYKCVPSPGG